MSRRNRRNLLFALKLIAIVGAAVFMFAGVKDTFIKAQGATEEVTQKTPIQFEQPEEREVHFKSETEPAEQDQTQESKSMVKSRDWDYEESYLLAKIAMAEAEGEDVEGKALVILVVLNRVWSDSFPGSIEEVILQHSEKSGVYQFSPVQPGGRWWTEEPNAECWEAVSMVQDGWDESDGALYFESVGKSQWHRENLQFLFQHGNHYFYTDKETEQ